MQSFVVELVGAAERDQVLSGLAERGIHATIAGYSLFEQPYWIERYALNPKDYPVAERMGRCGITLPVVAGMDEDDVDRIVSALDVLGGAA
jgi:dTDP-4-amino-4,6-dideoxygalactose transaminase